MKQMSSALELEKGKGGGGWNLISVGKYKHNDIAVPADVLFIIGDACAGFRRVVDDVFDVLLFEYLRQLVYAVGDVVPFWLLVAIAGIGKIYRFALVDALWRLCFFGRLRFLGRRRVWRRRCVFVFLHSIAVFI